jgi:hypothetical protein
VSSEAKHTPGEWLYVPFAGNTAAEPQRRYVLLGPPLVCDKHGCGFAREEDANLICAAKDLLAACEAVIDAFTCDYIPDTKKANAMLRTRAAIARAQPPAHTEG